MWKLVLLYILSIFLSLIVLPATLVGGWWKWDREMEKDPLFGPQADFLPPAQHEELLLKIYLAEEREMVEMPLEEYIAGVVMAEMPASFHPEALKAQAVIARTYALEKASRPAGGCSAHPGADLCTLSTCCQAWEDTGGASAKWPAEEASAYLQKISAAVLSTQGLILTYEGKPAQAVYHSTCGGVTEAATEVWSGGIAAPYLQSVECAFCRHSPHYTRETNLEVAFFAAAFAGDEDALPVLGDGDIPLMEVVQRTAGGRNKLLRIGRSDRLYRGEEVRSLLGLPSTFFRWQAANGQIVFSTRGYGHGVGLCQYGADGMASQGYNFTDILDYYYRETEVAPWSLWTD